VHLDGQAKAKSMARYGIDQGIGIVNKCGMKVSLKVLKQGLDRAIRAAPDEIVSSPGYFTIVR